MITEIVISGYYGFANAGDEAMLTALIASLRKVVAHAEITVITGNPALTRKNHGVNVVHRFNLLAIAFAVRRCDLLISGGGSLLQDVTSSRSLYYYLMIMRIALFFNKPVMLYAQGIGPINGAGARESVRKVLQRAALITVRDEESLVALRNIGVTVPPVEVTADAVLSVPLPEKEIGAAILEKYGVPKKGKKIGIAFRNWQGLEDHKSELAEAADRLTRLYDSRIVFIPMQFPADVQAAEEIAAHMSEDAIVLKEAYNTEEFMSLIGAMDLIIANRLHALVFAAVMDIPVTAVSYDPKIDGFVSLIGETVCTTMGALSAAAVVEDASAKLQHRAKDEAVRARIQALKNRAWRNNILVAELLKKSGRYSE